MSSNSKHKTKVPEDVAAKKNTGQSISTKRKIKEPIKHDEIEEAFKGILNDDEIRHEILSAFCELCGRANINTRAELKSNPQVFMDSLNGALNRQIPKFLKAFKELKG